jgi:hypothetical protein
VYTYGESPDVYTYGESPDVYTHGQTRRIDVLA